ncbi:MAG: glucose-1-phosphate adenylyltransferase, partial [Verrucomicrobia bacterium]|nr:glucose-1-phosphate adenylyltransferase [Verrucomicrobiota bacterium]
MKPTQRGQVTSRNVLCVIMGGGQGSRLFPLTKERAKPAVPLAGKYRLVDIPISNCINSGFRRIYVLTQFNSTSMHRHLSWSYKFDHFSGGFVEVLAAQQTFADTSWYQGTADAVRKNMQHFLNHDFDYLLILSGDQLYRMDFRQVVTQHIDSQAEVTIATIPVNRNDAQSLGIMQINSDRIITRFEEKPKDPAVLDGLRLDRGWYEPLGIGGGEELFLASMGIYVFNRPVIKELLNNSFSDFGKHIIPKAIDTHRVGSFVYQGYWEDIGTIRSFFEANLDLTAALPRFNFFDMHAPIFSRPRFLPGTKINGAEVERAVIADGCIINSAKIRNSIVGVRSVINSGTELHRVVGMGCDFFESLESIEQHEREGLPRMGIGSNCRIENTIIDKNARIGDNVIISPKDKPDTVDHDLYFIRDGIVIIPKGAIIPHGTV